jgi:hypothetical protein
MVPSSIWRLVICEAATADPPATTVVIAMNARITPGPDRRKLFTRLETGE